MRIKVEDWSISDNATGDISKEDVFDEVIEEEELSSWKLFLYGINPINIEEWSDMRFYAKFYEIFKVSWFAEE